MKSNGNSRLVYNSDSGRIKQDKSGNKPASQVTDGVVRLRREVKGRGGGTVIVISGLPNTSAQIKELAGTLKKKCGCGGTVKDGVIEIQGDHRDALLLELQTRGYKVKLAGG